MEGTMRIYVALALVGLACVAKAQTQFYPVSQRVMNYGSSGAVFHDIAVNASVSHTSNQLSIHNWGDQATRLGSEQYAFGYAGQESFFGFQTGFAPLLVNSLRVKGNSRTILGGGSSGAPESRLYEYLYLGEYREQDGVPGFNPFADSLIAWVSTNLVAYDVRTGNGYREHSIDQSVQPNYVLGSYTNYVLWFGTFYYAYGDTRGLPTVTITHEYGGPYSSSFDGYRAEMNFTSLPEPSALIGLSAGLIPFMRRRRR